MSDYAPIHYMDLQRILESSRGADHAAGGLDLDEMKVTLKRVGWPSGGGRAELEPVMADLYGSLTTPQQGLPADLMGLIAASADSKTRRAMMKGQVVSAGDVMYQLPPEQLSYTDIKTYAGNFPLPNRYDTHLHAIAGALRAYIAERDNGPLSELSDNMYAAMAYYLLTNGRRGLKVSDIKDLAIVTPLQGRSTIYIGRGNKEIRLRPGARTFVEFHTDGKLSRMDGPSSIVYDKSATGALTFLKNVYFVGDKRHREAGPAEIIYHDGALYVEKYYVDGKIHCADGPAALYYNKDGKVNKEEYWVDGKKHRADGPAKIYYNKDGTVSAEEYWMDDKKHRIDGPAQVNYKGDGTVSMVQYWVDDKKHRADGPAVLYYKGDGTVIVEEYWVNGNHVDGLH